MTRTGLFSAGMVKKAFYQGEGDLSQSFKTGGSLGAKKDISQNVSQMLSVCGKEVICLEGHREEDLPSIPVELLACPERKWFLLGYQW